MILSKSLIVVAALTAQALGNAVAQPDSAKVARSHPREFARSLVPAPDPGPIIGLKCKLFPETCRRARAVQEPNNFARGNANGNVPNPPRPPRPGQQPRDTEEINGPPICPTSDSICGGPVVSRPPPVRLLALCKVSATNPTGQNSRGLAERNNLPMCGGDECEPVIDRRREPSESRSGGSTGFVPRPRPGARDLAEIPEGGYVPLLQRDAPNQSHDPDPSTFPTRPNTGNQ